MLSLFLCQCLAHGYYLGQKGSTVNSAACASVTHTHIRILPALLVVVHCLRCFGPFLGGSNSLLRLKD